jgi:hypothetical protein
MSRSSTAAIDPAGQRSDYGRRQPTEHGNSKRLTLSTEPVDKLVGVRRSLFINGYGIKRLAKLPIY